MEAPGSTTQAPAGRSAILSGPERVPAAGAQTMPTQKHDRRPEGKTRVAVIGAGYIADYHLTCVGGIEECEIVALVDTDRARAESLARRFGVECVRTSIEDLATLQVDVAHLLTPPDTHVALVGKLLDMGISVFAEKPLALSAADARALDARARARGLVVGVNHNNVHHPAFTRLLERVAAGEIGRVEHVQVTLSVPLAQLDAGDFAHWMFREPRNIVFEAAVHPLGQVHALIGAPRHVETTLISRRELHPGQVFVDRWSASGTGERGSMQIYCAFGQGFTRNTLQVLGTDGSLEADLFHNTLSGERKTGWLDFWNSYLASARRGAEMRRDARATAARWFQTTLGVAPRLDAFFVGMRESIERFHAAYRAGIEPPTDAARASEVLAWCDALASAAPAAPPPPPEPPAAGPARAGEVVVLGATGFIGTRTVAKLLEAGSPVTVVARRAHSLPPIVAEGVKSGRIRFVRGRLEDQASLAQAFAGADAVISLATGNGDTWEAVERSMVKGSVGAAEAALAAGLRRFVYVSSIASLYTGPDATGNEVRDSTATDPLSAERSLYSRGKIAAEVALLELHRAKGLPLVIARPGVVMGAGTPMQHSGLGIWNRDNHCVGWGHGQNPLPIVWVDDVADGLAKMARYKGTDVDGQALNLCARAPLTAAEIVTELRVATGRDLHFHPRGLELSQTLEIGKWVVKKAGRRAGVEFPSWRDLKARALGVVFACDLAREKLGWKPVEDREGLLDRCVRVYRQKS
ncbi:MAG: NAD-dependent epimerase/dehydratase family protein [Planctomycetota bacterium]|nr:NAD-dependent epimerase/dehydratase family protein [Planctomycetota bacterium]